MRLKAIWKDKYISLRSKIRLIRSLAMSIFLCACETGTLTAELQRRVQTMEMRCYRKILCISYKDHVTNEEVHNRIQQAIGPYEDLITTVKGRKLKWYGHVSRTSSLTKTILQGTVRLARRRGRQRKRWEDNVREWTGLDFSDTQRAADGRQRWRQLVKGLMMMTMMMMMRLVVLLHRPGCYLFQRLPISSLLLPLIILFCLSYIPLYAVLPSQLRPSHFL